MFVFIFAPAISNFNPDFQKDLKVTRLLSPFSFKKVLHLKYQSKKKLGKEDKFILDKKNVARQSFDESIAFADSVPAGPRSPIGSSCTTADASGGTSSSCCSHASVPMS